LKVTIAHWLSFTSCLPLVDLAVREVDTFHFPCVSPVGSGLGEEGVDAVMTCPLEQSLVFFLNNGEIVSEPVP